MTWTVIADEHVKRVFVTELRAHGFDVEWIDTEYEAGTSDRAHLERSAETGAIILSNDSDFIRQHDEYEHAGIVLYADQNVSVTDFIRAFKRIERHVRASELAGNVVWLDGWVE
jgi:uncharacterized protein with PIN domain